MIDIFISPTSLDRMQQCWRLYYYTSKRKLVPFYRPQRMERGSVGHKVLAYYYKEIGYNTQRETPKHRDQIIEEAMKIGMLEAARTEVDKENLATLVETLESYFRNYRNEDWVPLLDDRGEPLVEVPLTKVVHEEPDTENGEGLRVVFNGIIDLILAARKGVGVTIVDHKFPSQKMAFISMHNQLSLYSAVTGIQNVLRNDAGSQKEGNINKFSRPAFRYDPAQMKENLQWAIHWAQEAHYHETTEVFPPNPTACDKWGGCQMLGVCNTTPGAREAVISASFKIGRKFSIYEKEEPIAQIAAVPEDKEQVVAAVDEPEKVDSDAPTSSVEVVHPVRDTSGEVRDGQREDGEHGGLESLPRPSETLADRLLKEALRR